MTGMPCWSLMAVKFHCSQTSQAVRRPRTILAAVSVSIVEPNDDDDDDDMQFMT